MKSWKTTLGGALSTLGTTLMGIGIVPQLSGAPSELLSILAIIGFVLNGVGGFFSKLWAADHDTMVEMAKAMKKAGMDTTRFYKEKPPEEKK